MKQQTKGPHSAPRRYSQVVRVVLLRHGAILNLLGVIGLAGVGGCTSPKAEEPNTTEGARTRFKVETGAIMPTSAGRMLLDQCTRSGPWGVRSFWTPTPAMVAEFETKLAPVLESTLRREVSNGREPPTASEFYRQYVGIERWTGRRTVYVNGFHQQYVAVRSRSRSTGDTSAGPDTLDWRVTPVSVCDGGRRFFGAEYDPADSTVSSLRFNGRASR
jgi:hypothetical protein